MKFSPQDKPADGHPLVILPCNLTHAPEGAGIRQPDGLTPWQHIRHLPLRRDGLGRQGALPLTQRRRIRNRCWQLLCCRFLRGQRRLDLQPWLPASPSKPMRPHGNGSNSAKNNYHFLPWNCLLNTHEYAVRKEEKNRIFP